MTGGFTPAPGAPLPPIPGGASATAGVPRPQALPALPPALLEWAQAIRGDLAAIRASLERWGAPSGAPDSGVGDLDPDGPNKFNPVHHEPFPDQPVDPDRFDGKV